MIDTKPQGPSGGAAELNGTLPELKSLCSYPSERVMGCHSDIE